MPHYFLTERERDLIQQLIDQMRRGQVNVPSRPPLAFNENEDHQSPEFYIALPPLDGIPALTRGAGTGTGVDEESLLHANRPGSATCSVYRILENESGNAEVQPVEGLTRRVYNLSTTAIDQDWITVQRTKFGEWVANTGGGCQCEDRNEIWQIFVIGSPTEGAFDLILTVDGETESITIPHDATESEVETLLLTHSALEDDDVIVTGGPLPSINVTVEFTGNQAAKSIPPPFTDTSGLHSPEAGTGTGSAVGESGFFGVIVTRFQPGFPNV